MKQHFNVFFEPENLRVRRFRCLQRGHMEALKEEMKEMTLILMLQVTKGVWRLNVSEVVHTELMV